VAWPSPLIVPRPWERPPCPLRPRHLLPPHHHPRPAGRPASLAARVCVLGIDPLSQSISATAVLSASGRAPPDARAASASSSAPRAVNDRCAGYTARRANWLADFSKSMQSCLAVCSRATLVRSRHSRSSSASHAHVLILARSKSRLSRLTSCQTCSRAGSVRMPRTGYFRTPSRCHTGPRRMAAAALYQLQLQRAFLVELGCGVAVHGQVEAEAKAAASGEVASSEATEAAKRQSRTQPADCRPPTRQPSSPSPSHVAASEPP